MSRVLVVAPHPDDETLGCGGTLLRHRNDGDEIHWMIMTRISESAGYSKESVESRKNEIADVAKTYGFSSIHQAKFETTTLDTIAKRELVEEVSSVMNSVKPEIIYVPYRNDVHSDHKVIFDVVAACTKSFRYPFIRKVRAYETLSETEFGITPESSGFRPNLWIDITEHLEKKIMIMKKYKGEMGKHPFPRSERNINALATIRGATAGVEAAEAFLSLKEII
jgi:LmbE family N-acetylglucosaminyl deacetylase